MSARVLKSIPGLLDAFFFFLLLFLLSAEGDDEFPSPGSCANKILILPLVQVFLVHAHPGDNIASIHGTPRAFICLSFLHHVSLPFQVAVRGWNAPFLLHCYHLEPDDNLSEDVLRKNECRHMTASTLHLNYVFRQLVLRTLTLILATRK